jgi:hypothetical protein
MTPARHRMSFVAVVAVAASLAMTVPVGRIQASSGILYKWKPLGPEPSCCFFPGGETGRATAIAVNPFNKDDVWIGAAGGGVWHSTDGGATWAPMSDDQESLAIGAIALAGCNATFCSGVYAGTGENAIRRDTYYGAGLLIGTFNGSSISWSRVTGGPTYNFGRASIYNVVLDPTTSGPTQVIYVTVSSGVSASATESTITAPEYIPGGGYGIYKSSNNGATWGKVLTAPSRPSDLEIDRTNHLVLYAGIMGKGVYRSKNAGGTWCPLNPGIPAPAACLADPPSLGLPNPNNTTFDHVEIATDPHLPQPQSHLYATFGRCANPLLNDCQPSLYESTDSGTTWTQRYAGSTSPSAGDYACPAGYSRYTHALTVDPSDSNALLLGGVHLCRWTHSGGWVSADASAQGCTIQACTTHFDHRAVVFAPSDPLRAYDANDGGIAVSTNGGTAWKAANNGLGIVEFQSIASSPFSTSLIGGTQDNAGMEWIGAALWDHLSCCGDGGFAVMEHNGATNALKDDMYVTSNVGSVASTIVVPVRSENGGASWQYPPSGNGYDVGLLNNVPRSFYPPFIEDQTFALYFGTNALLKSTNGSDTYTTMSPALSADAAPEIVGGVDAITAIAVAPSNPSRVYLGFYSGRTFYSTSPCSGAACWHEGTRLFAPVTWIAVDPVTQTQAYASVSGFYPGGHVWKTVNGGVTWVMQPTAAELSGVPANTVMIDPDNASRLWLGTDKGVYKSESAGASWARYSAGLPNVPVYAFTFTGDGKSLVAATHGRGAWILTSSSIKPFVDGPSQQLVLDGPVLGDGFAPHQTCRLKILRQDGTVCASGPTDALGGTMTTDARGFLVSSKPGLYSETPVVWACAQGKCLDRDVMSCNEDKNPMAAVVATCGGQIARQDVDLGQLDQDPPTAVLGLTGLLPAGEAGSVDLAAAGSFTLAPAVQAQDGTTRLLCTTSVPFGPSDTSADVLQRAGGAVNASTACRTAGVTAEFLTGDRGGQEDDFREADRLSLSAPLLTGSRLVPAVQAAIGGATGLCFNLDQISRPSRSQILGMQIQFTTPPTGVSGGTLRVTERSALGECAIDVPIPPGLRAIQVAQAVAGAFQATGIPGPYPSCPARANPRDVTLQGDTVLTSFASEVEVCIGDPNLGVALVPEDICFTASDCNDANPCTTDACNAAGQCTHLPVANGNACTDNDACTIGGTCQGGICGTRVICNDGNACTSDACNPATGVCVSQAIECDDGNVCTQDSCNGATGHCIFAPLTGSACDDGDPCSTGDTCVVQTSQPGPVCVGSFRCDDSDPCTVDRCDPDTGACLNLPIECADGNPCTVDNCQAGACVSTQVFGVPCDDQDRCTAGDTCVSNPTNGFAECRGTATACDDSNPCTADACNPVTGGCDHTLIPLHPIAVLQFIDNIHVLWSSQAGARYYNSYRGTIPAGGLRSRLPGSAYDQTCFEAHDVRLDGPTISTDVENPPVGTAFYYLATDVESCGEAPLGEDSNGSETPNGAPCPFI